MLSNEPVLAHVRATVHAVRYPLIQYLLILRKEGADLDYATVNCGRRGIGVGSDGQIVLLAFQVIVLSVRWMQVVLVRSSSDMITVSERSVILP